MADQRPSKKQRELLQFIDGFIKGYGYGPSYRETMRALGYKSVSTVATHVDGLIARGYLRKKDHSARSIEIVTQSEKPATPETAHEKWLRAKVKARLSEDISEGERQIIERAMELLGVKLPSQDS